MVKTKSNKLFWKVKDSSPRLTTHPENGCLRVDVSYFLCCTCNKGNRRRLHAGNQNGHFTAKLTAKNCRMESWENCIARTFQTNQCDFCSQRSWWSAVFCKQDGGGLLLVFIAFVEPLIWSTSQRSNPWRWAEMLIGKSFVCYSKIDRDPVSVLLEIKGKAETLLFESGAIAELCKYICSLR